MGEYLIYLLAEPYFILVLIGIVALLILRKTNHKGMNKSEYKFKEIEQAHEYELIKRDHYSEKGMIDKYGELLGRVMYILNETDIEGLIRSGAPKDEYQSEAQTILPRLQDCNSSNDVRKVIIDEFRHWFGSSSMLLKLSNPVKIAASLIWEVWTNFEEINPPAGSKPPGG